MALSQALHDCIERAVKGEMNLGGGVVTKQAIMLRARADARRLGIDSEVTIAAENSIWLSGIDRHLKRGLPDNVIRLAFRNAPPDQVQKMKYLPRFIALSEGANAEWVDSLKASPEQWRMNWALKNKKAAQTKAKATDSLDVARFLEEYGMASLSDCMEIETAA